MPNHPVIDDIAKASLEKLFPTVTYWNRLEGRPRTDNFERALRAEVRDPLWMLCKQWQMGEFEGDDAGSPCLAKVQVEHSELTQYRPADHAVRPFSRDLPLEAQVEQRPIPFTSGQQIMSLDLRLAMGRRWLKMLARRRAADPNFGDYATVFIEKFGIAKPEPNTDAQAAVLAHQEVWQQVVAVAGRNMDGYQWYRRLRDTPPANWLDGLAVAVGDAPIVLALSKTFVEWFEKQFLQPFDPADNAWKPEALEYACACSTPLVDGEKVLVAEEYHEGRLEWYNFDVDASRRALGQAPQNSQRQLSTQSFLPAPISFNGMPNTRWWTFEDGKTNFGDIKPDTTDLAKLMLVEFGLVYANDWFMLPFTLPLGSLARITGLAVTNVFGERTWVVPAGSGTDSQWQRWNMFTLNTKGGKAAPADRHLLVLPTVPKMQEGKPLEEVTFFRDEVANMVWGVETQVPVPTGLAKSGKEAAADLRKYFAQKYPAPAPLAPAEGLSAVHYELMTTVPENWIPFIAVKISENGQPSDREIRLQRGSMLRRYAGMPEAATSKIKPRTALLREGLEAQPPRAYYLNEEEVPRVGIRVFQSYQRTRWLDGRVCTWLGVRKTTGRGEGSSGLMFDGING